MQIKSDVAQHLADKLDINLLKMNLLNQLSDHIHQLGNDLMQALN